MMSRNERELSGMSQPVRKSVKTAIRSEKPRTGLSICQGETRFVLNMTSSLSALRRLNVCKTAMKSATGARMARIVGSARIVTLRNVKNDWPCVVTNVNCLSDWVTQITPIKPDKEARNGFASILSRYLSSIRIKSPRARTRRSVSSRWCRAIL